MKHLPLAALLVLAPACGGGTDAASPTESTAEAPLLPADSAPIPTAQEAADEAAKEITEENAEAELEKLKKELEDN